MKTVLSDNFVTELGTVQSFIQSDFPETFISCDSNSITTLGHKITLEIFELQNSWLPDKMHFAISRGWRWFIQKINENIEHLEIQCKLINPGIDTTWDSATGQYLDAISITNKSYELHIGTEDGEMLQVRAIKNDWMPNRFKNEIGTFKSFIDQKNFGFIINVPDLNQSEKIYFHFLVATNFVKKSSEYPTEDDISTWCAVDQSKKFLDNYLS